MYPYLLPTLTLQPTFQPHDLPYSLKPTNLRPTHPLTHIPSNPPPSTTGPTPYPVFIAKVPPPLIPLSGCIMSLSLPPHKWCDAEFKMAAINIPGDLNARIVTKEQSTR